MRRLRCFLVSSVLLALPAAGAAQQAPLSVISPNHYHLLFGYVLGSSGSALGQAGLELFDSSGGLLATGTSDDSGQFRFWTTNPGPYELKVEWNQQTATATMGGSGAVQVAIAPPALSPRRADAGATVSRNDLAAPPKARAKLAAALKALRKPDFNRALSFADAALRIDPQWGRAYYVRGLIAYERRLPAAAEADLDTARDDDASYAPTYVTLAAIQIAADRTPEAEVNLRHALTLSPMMWQANFALAALDLDAGKNLEALQMALNAAADPGAPPECHFIAAEAARRQQSLPQAVAQYRAYLTARPRSAQDAALARQQLAQLDPSHPPPQ